MKKNKCWTIYVIMWFIMIIYLGISNHLACMAIPQEQVLRKVKINEYKSTTEPVICIDEILEYIGGTYEYVYCGGWAFCETDYSNENKTISVIFKRVESEVAYACVNIPQLRQDVYDTFKNTKRIYNGNTSVTCKFSTINLPNGTYEMLIYVYENEFDYGIASTGQYYKKSANSFVKVNAAGEEIDVNYTDETLSSESFISIENFFELGNWYIDEIELTEDLLSIAGWASYSEETNDEQKIYIAVTYIDGSTKYYSTQSQSRRDVADYFENNSYLYCGFASQIPMGTSDVKALSLFVEVDGKYYPIALNAKIFDEKNGEQK